MNLFSKADKCFLTVISDHADVRFQIRTDPALAKASLNNLKIHMENYYAAAEAAIKATQLAEAGRG